MKTLQKSVGKQSRLKDLKTCNIKVGTNLVNVLKKKYGKHNIKSIFLFDGITIEEFIIENLQRRWVNEKE
jgi:hypothetical protein